MKVTPKRLKTTHVRTKNNPTFAVVLTPDWELKELFFRSKNDPKFRVKLGVKVIPLSWSILYLKFLLHFWSYNNSLNITVQKTKEKRKKPVNIR